MGGLTLNTNSPATATAASAPTSNVQPPQAATKAPQHSPQLPMNGGTSGAGPASGFAPFQPPRPPHQPITYTAGTFAQTKFGSTKLKSNAKKTNRMSPTEFSNYIKQRAMQKQGSSGQPPVQPQPQPQQPMNNVSSASNLMPIGMKKSPHFMVLRSQRRLDHTICFFCKRLYIKILVKFQVIQCKAVQATVTTSTTVTEASLEEAIWTMVEAVAEFHHIKIKIPTFTRFFLTAKGKMALAIFSQDSKDTSRSSSSSPLTINSLNRRLYWAVLLQVLLEALLLPLLPVPLVPIHGHLGMRTQNYSCKTFWLWGLVRKLVNLNSRTLEQTRIWAYQVQENF